MSGSLILVVNTGSSSLKMGLYDVVGADEQLLLGGAVEGISEQQGRLRVLGPHGEVLQSLDLAQPTQVTAFHHLSEGMKKLSPLPPSAVGHRVVHGGPRLLRHQLITDAVLSVLEQSVHFAPLHIPDAVELIRESRRVFPGLPHFACFDTTFHCTLPERVTRFPLPQRYSDEGVRRYGFHGLSYESVLHQLGDDAPAKIVIAHLGSGASLAAISHGRSIDTSMGLTPTGGIPMATRSGDIDPGVLLYLMRVHGMNSDELERLLNRESGLKAISGGTTKMELIEADAANPAAQLAFEIFCLSVAKTIAAYSVSLDGLDLLVFTGGIGEHSGPVRSRVCALLRSSGVEIDLQRNEDNERWIATSSSAVKVGVLPSQEDLQIARHCRNLQI